MMDKDASSACCEDLKLQIDLPKAKGLSGAHTVHKYSRFRVLTNAAEIAPSTVPLVACVVIEHCVAEMDLDVQPTKILLTSPT